MPDEEQVTSQPEEVVEETTTPETPTVEETPTAEPHPLEPGGERFKQVWARAKSAEEKADRLEREMESLRAAQQQHQPPTQSLEAQVEAAVEAGTMTQLQAIRLLSKHYAKQEAKETVQSTTQELTEKQRLQEASDIIQSFVNVAPDIETLSHPRIGEVKANYDKLLKRGYKPGLPTEALSLEMTFGSPDALKRRRNPTDRTTVPVTSGGTSVPQTTSKTKSELDGIPQRYLNYWKARGYSHEQMVAESKYLTPEQRARKD